MYIKYLNLLIILFLSLSMIFADSDGVWHNAEDIRGGIIAFDEKDDTTSFTFINDVFINSTLEVSKNKASLNLVGSDHTYIQFFPDGKSSGRKAWFGFGDGLSNDLSIQSESGYLLLNPNTENVGIGTSTPSTKLEILGTTTSTDFECFNCIDEEDLSQNQIDDSEIQDNSLTSLSLAPNSVGGSELIPIYESGSVYNSRFVNVGEINSISSSMILDSTISGNDLTAVYKSGSVYDNRFINVGESGDTIKDNTIDSSEIQDGTITGNDLTAVYKSGSVYDNRFINVGESGDTIKDNTIDSSEIQDGTITGNDLSINYRSGSVYDSRFMQIDTSGSYGGIKDSLGSTSNWIRTTKNGFIPHAPGTSYIGTPSWPFGSVHAKIFYDDGQKLATEAYVNSNSGGVSGRTIVGGCNVQRSGRRSYCNSWGNCVGAIYMYGNEYTWKENQHNTGYIIDYICYK